jgi:hypothetical protein
MSRRSFLAGCLLLLAACAPQQESPGREAAPAAASGAPVETPRPGVGQAAAPAAGPRLPVDQLEAMFRAAMAQAKPFPPQKAVCFGIDGEDREVTDPPEALRQALARELGLPGFPASQCSFDIYPYVTASRDQAMLYTVRVMETNSAGLRFMAIATYGNLGANGEEFRLVRRAGRWVPEPTGLRVVS